MLRGLVYAQRFNLGGKSRKQLRNFRRHGVDCTCCAIAIDPFAESPNEIPFASLWWCSSGWPCSLKQTQIFAILLTNVFVFTTLSTPLLTKCYPLVVLMKSGLLMVGPSANRLHHNIFSHRSSYVILRSTQLGRPVTAIVSGVPFYCIFSTCQGWLSVVFTNMICCLGGSLSVKVIRSRKR